MIPIWAKRMMRTGAMSRMAIAPFRSASSAMNPASFDHFVGAGDDRRRDGQA